MHEWRILLRMLSDRQNYSIHQPPADRKRIMDIIFIHELQVTTLIGIYEREKHVPQTLQLDLEIALPNSRACFSDDINDALNYAKVIQHIENVLSEGHFSLVETLAEHIAQIILQDFKAPWVKVSVAKLQAIRSCKMVGICIERGIRPLS